MSEDIKEVLASSEEVEASEEVKKEKKKKSNLVGKLIIIGMFVAAIVIYFAVPSVHAWINNLISMFKSGDFDSMRAFIAKYGEWAMLVSGLLMIFQSIAAPLPAFFITLTNANLFGWWQGCILSWVSSMAGAALCFYIARILGRDTVEKICTKGALLSIEKFFEKYGKKCILIARLLPFISFDVVSYAAGLTAMDFWGFFVATGIGQLPACIVYSYVGGMLTGGAKKLFMGLVILFALAMIIVVVKQAYTANEKKKEQAALESGEVYVKEPFCFARFFSKFYNASYWGMIIGILSYSFGSIVMSMNIGWMFYIGWIVAWATLLLIRSFDCGIKFTLINTAASLAAIFVLCGSGVTRTPASLARQGLGMMGVPFSTFNTGFVVFIVLGLGLTILFWKLNNKKAKED